jgi:hypothetical protein
MLNLGTIYTNVHPFSNGYVLNVDEYSDKHLFSDYATFTKEDFASEDHFNNHQDFFNNELYNTELSSKSLKIYLVISNIFDHLTKPKDYIKDNIDKFNYLIEVSYHSSFFKNKLVNLQKLNYDDEHIEVTHDLDTETIKVDLRTIDSLFKGIGFLDKVVCVIKVNEDAYNPTGSDSVSIAQLGILGDYSDLAKFTIRNDRNKIYTRAGEAVTLRG